MYSQILKDETLLEKFFGSFTIQDNVFTKIDYFIVKFPIFSLAQFIISFLGYNGFIKNFAELCYSLNILEITISLFSYQKNKTIILFGHVYKIITFTLLFYLMFFKGLKIEIEKILTRDEVLRMHDDKNLEMGVWSSIDGNLESINFNSSFPSKEIILSYAPLNKTLTLSRLIRDDGFKRWDEEYLYDEDWSVIYSDGTLELYDMMKKINKNLTEKYIYAWNKTSSFVILDNYENSLIYQKDGLVEIKGFWDLDMTLYNDGIERVSSFNLEEDFERKMTFYDFDEIPCYDRMNKNLKTVCEAIYKEVHYNNSLTNFLNLYYTIEWEFTLIRVSNQFKLTLTNNIRLQDFLVKLTKDEIPFWISLISCFFIFIFPFFKSRDKMNLLLETLPVFSFFQSTILFKSDMRLRLAISLCNFTLEFTSFKTHFSNNYIRLERLSKIISLCKLENSCFRKFIIENPKRICFDFNNPHIESGKWLLNKKLLVSIYLNHVKNYESSYFKFLLYCFKFDGNYNINLNESRFNSEWIMLLKNGIVNSSFLKQGYIKNLSDYRMLTLCYRTSKKETLKAFEETGLLKKYSFDKLVKCLCFFSQTLSLPMKWAKSKNVKRIHFKYDRYLRVVENKHYSDRNEKIIEGTSQIVNYISKDSFRVEIPGSESCIKIESKVIDKKIIEFKKVSLETSNLFLLDNKLKYYKNSKERINSIKKAKSLEGIINSCCTKCIETNKTLKKIIDNLDLNIQNMRRHNHNSSCDKKIPIIVKMAFEKKPKVLQNKDLVFKEDNSKFIDGFVTDEIFFQDRTFKKTIRKLKKIVAFRSKLIIKENHESATNNRNLNKKFTRVSFFTKASNETKISRKIDYQKLNKSSTVMESFNKSVAGVVEIIKKYYSNIDFLKIKNCGDDYEKRGSKLYRIKKDKEILKFDFANQS